MPKHPANGALPKSSQSARDEVIWKGNGYSMIMFDMFKDLEFVPVESDQWAHAIQMVDVTSYSASTISGM